MTQLWGVVGLPLNLVEKNVPQVRKGLVWWKGQSEMIKAARRTSWRDLVAQASASGYDSSKFPQLTWKWPNTSQYQYVVHVFTSD